MSPNRILGLLALPLLLAPVGVPSACGQQVLVDDPTSVPPGAAQLEAWHGREASWIIPALRVHPRLEVAVGTAFLRRGATNRRSVEHTVEGKVLLRPGSTHRLGVAAVVGGGVARYDVAAGRPETIYAYVPLSQTLVPGRLTVYETLGWLHERLRTHRLTWGVRLDWAVAERFTLIGEVAGEGRAAPSAQLALRTALLPGHVEIDVSVTRAGLGAAPTTWATVGLTFMSDPLF